MSNEESREVKDTRGRPRNDVMIDIAGQVEDAYMLNKLPVSFTAASMASQALALSGSAAAIRRASSKAAR